MNFQIMEGKRSGSEVFFVEHTSSLYVKKKKTNLKMFVGCYFDKCSASGFIENEKFFNSKDHAEHDILVHSENDTLNKLIEFNFMNDLRNECGKSSTDNKRKIYEKVFQK